MGVRKRGKNLTCAWILAVIISTCESASVSEVQPRYGSMGGETRLTISGSGFSADQFSQNEDPDTGNMVYLVSESGSEYSCPVHNDGTTETQIMCYTPNGMQEENHYVKVVVDGTRVQDSYLCNGNPTGSSCTYKPSQRYTPTVTSLSAQSGRPGGMIEITGKLFTDRYGSNLASATNGRTEKLLRVYVGPQDCDLKENDDFYGLQVEEDTDNGNLKCKAKGSSVGFFNATYIVESPFGRSVADGELYRVSYNDEIYLYQTYTDITNISHSVGSEAGGLRLTIYGSYFDEKAPYSKARAYVGDTVCDVKNVVTDEYVECIVAADPQYTASKFEGNRGVNFEYWTSTSKGKNDLDSILSLSSSDPGYNSTTLDDTYFYDNNEMDTYASRMTSYFRPPHTGEYEFQLYADDGARLYVDGNEAVTSTRSWKSSARMPLNENRRYLLEVTHYENNGDSFIHLRAKFFDTEFTSSWTAKAKQETQTIKITSTVKFDEQQLAFSRFTGQTHTQEVQKVEITQGDTFRLGLFGVFTEPLMTTMEDSMIQTALGSLPIWGADESILVTRNPSDPPSYQLTFQSKRGDFPKVDVRRVANNSGVVSSVTEQTKGVPDLDMVALSFDDIVSEPFSVDSLDAGTLKSAVEGMFSAKCPTVFSSPSKAAYYQNFESGSSEFWGTRVMDTEPFCGRYVLKNPFRIYRQASDEDVGIMLSMFGTVCFAYKGFLANIIGVKYSYRDNSDQEVKDKNLQFAYEFQTDSATVSNGWYYACVDVYDKVYDERPSDTEHRLLEAWVYRANSGVDAYVDSLFIGRDTTTDDPEVHLRRLNPALPRNSVVDRSNFVDRVSVDTVSADTYKVTIVPIDCGFNFPLFELANGGPLNLIGSSTSSPSNITELSTSSTVNSTDTTTSSPKSSTNITTQVTSGVTSSSGTTATLALDNGRGSGVVTVTRTSQASPPVTGFVDVSFDGHGRNDINVSLEAAEFERELESIQDIGSLSVIKDGDCANFDMITTFISLPGDLPQMTVSYDRLQGIEAQGSIETNVHGGLFYDPLTGDMVSTVHSSPQVRLFINDIPTACTDDCSFSWDSSSTPTISGINPQTGTSSLSTSAVITGTGFSTVRTNNKVIIGGVECSVTGSTATSITCDVGNGPVGPHSVVVTVDGKGNAEGSVQFTYTASISSLAPTSGSLGGGGNLTISGFGFKNGANVTINSKNCPVVSIQADTIVCLVPQSTSAGTYDVVVDQESSSLSYSGYTYDSGLTALVSNVVPATIDVSGDNITISGSSFSSNNGSVFVGSVEADITSWSDSQIVISVSDVFSGSQELRIEAANGYAVKTNTFELPTLNVDLKITNVYPLQGSLLGGTKLTITGSGFGTDDNAVVVKIGAVNCEIFSLTNTQILCQIEDAGTIHQVTNRGIDPAFGVYYAYDKPFISINEGDFVNWSWETPAFVNDIAHSITEVESPSATVAKEGGFSSGSASRDGSFRHQFVKAGRYYVWSGFVDIYGIKYYHGTIEVVPAQSTFGEVSVKVGRAEALHNVGGASNPSDGSNCQSVTSGKQSCSDSKAAVSDANKFNFAFWTCSSPVVNSVSVNNGTTKTDIVIKGEGFSNTECQNEVSFGGVPCIVKSSFEDTLTCNLENSGEPELGILHQIDMRVHNRGKARINIVKPEDRGFAVIPNIEQITPTSGSLAGGALLTVSGYGFGDSSMVKVDGYQCNIITNTYKEIVCETPRHTIEGQKDVTVEAFVNGAALPAECETFLKKCLYSYASLYTPTVSGVSPSSMSGSTSFTIIGTALGSTTGEVSVSFGNVMGTVTSVNGTVLVVDVDNIPAGNNDVFVRIKDYGKASGSLTVSGILTISRISPSSGSIHGYTKITIEGNGFVNQTTVTIDGTTCEIETTSLSEVICVTKAHAAGSTTVAVTSNSISESSTYNYATSATPTITSLNPAFGVAGQTLTITGSNLSGGNVAVTIGQSSCDYISGNAGEIKCTIGDHPTGMANVLAHVAELGYSNSNIQFEYQLSIDSILPIRGGTAGGQIVVIDGTGFDDSAVVTICGQTCQQTLVTSSLYTCKTPSGTDGSCDVSIILNGLTKTLPNAYTYDSTLTPSISAVSPRRGGTGGGTTLTITGSGFGIVQGNVKVEIDGTVCVVSGVVDTEIECVTGPHMGSINSKVEVQVSGNGIAQESSSGDADFEYIDVWSSLFTWGSGPLPQAGEFVIIPAGMTLLLDMDTPILSFLLIQGGRLIFDEKNIELQSNIIMITDGGLLQVGTEDKPFEHKAIITLHGHHRSKELPIYGTKVLAVRNGTLDLHGKEVPLTWTRLASTSASGSNTLELVDPVEWNVGDEIVIASTGHRQSQRDNEKKRIAAISQDNRTLTLDSALEAEHVGVEETFDGTLVEMRGEVGLLTHNVVVRGNQDPQWQDEIKACAAGFNVGEFATQTCFQGRFGDEIGSSQFGAMILVHAPVYDTHEAQARISYVEVTFAGQAFRLGRYPIHFHLNGDMSTSYVRGCGIHKTFNRAVNIHGTHNTLVEKTVIYDIMGGAFFLEDGIETGNTLQYNLAVFVIGSSSLLNDDVTPASYWITNPNNTIQHNAAAGGTHFGYWYRMHEHPDGPSFTKSVCPRAQPLGIFRNNSAHSFGWFGLWIFESYFPLKGGCGGTEVEPAVFESLFAWNNDKGAESVNTGALQFVDFVLVQNRLAGYECKSIAAVPKYTDDSPMVKDSLIVGKTTVHPINHQGCTTAAIVLPMGPGFRVVNSRFVNFAESCYVFGFAKIAGTCSFGCGGFSYHVEALKYVNAPNKASYGWEWEGIILDKDGTTTGKSGNWTILPTSGTIPTDCEAASEFSFGLPGSMCPSQHKWHRFAFNNPSPKSLEGKNFIFTNQYGNSSVSFLKKRITHKPGWMCAFLSGATYKYHFENAAQIRNISFTGRFDDFGSEDYIFVELNVFEAPDRFTIDGGNSFINATVGGIDPSTAKNGDWEWDNANNKIKFIVHGRQRSRRSVGALSVDNVFTFSSFKCYYDNCIPPPDPRTIPPAITRPLSYDYWDDESVWNLTDDGYVTNVGFNGTQIPQDYENVRILLNTWVMVNMTSINKIGILLIEGVLEFADHPSALYTIEADFIIIKGGRLIIGWPDDPFNGVASIILRGNHSSPFYNAGVGPTVGSKAIGVFGGLDLFGKDVGTTWTELAATVNAGSNTITLKEQVQWSVDDEIVVGSTSFNVWQTESFKITAIASDNVTLTLNETLKYKHIAHNETLTNGLDISMGAAVGLLSRNIKIIGEDYEKLYKESYGARVLVGLVVDKGETYAGYARLSNVEFYHTGQEGYTEEYDPRFSVAFVAVGTVSDIRPSIVTKCSFHNGFNTAIGAFGIGSLNIIDNVVFGSIGNGIATSSDDTVLKHNLVSLMVATNSYQDRFEEFNPRWEAGIEAMSAKRLILQDNLVTASERIAFHVPLLECDDNTGNYSNNRMYANILGAVVLPEDPAPSNCAKLSGFIAWKNHDFGIYYQSKVNFVSENNLLIENSNGLVAIVNGPAILSHVYADKRVEIKNTTFVGQTSSFDCANDRLPSPDDNTELSANSRPSSPPNGGMVGLVFPNYNSGSNKAPIKPFKGLMSYNAIGGLTTISDVTFAKYGQTACKNNYAVTTNTANDDLQHPMTSERTTLIDVDSSHKIIYHRPNVGKINSADCVDMDCDALKKAMFKDLDGTFLGHIGTVIPQSEYEWGGDPRRGLGDYRIPKEMVTTVDGVRIPYNTIAPNKGIIRSENCTYVSNWQAYECFDDMNYEMLVIESMDSDTETRRLSPVAILGDGYIDLINGPQDHGWCSGYTCRKRVSTFHALVATDHEFLMHFTSTTPKHMRYRLLNVNANEGIKLTVWYSRPNRLDVFVNEQFKIATNARIDSNNRYIITMPQGNEYEPQLANGTGTNYYDKDRGEITFIIMGPEQIDIKSADTIIVSFGLPALTVADFYGDNLVENLAAFLNIPLTKVRIMNVVSAAGSGKRKRRSSNGITVEVEIGDEPASDVNSTVSDSIDYTSLLNLASDIVNECQVGNVSQTLNITGGCQTVELPSTDPSVASIKYNTPSPDHLFFYTKPVADYEGIFLTTQPKIRAADISNNVVTELGTAEYPWQMTVSVRQGTGHPSNNLSGILMVNCSDGWFNFSDLAMSHMGTGYILDFNVTYPPEAENFTLATDPFDVAGRPLKVNLYEATSGDITTNSQFSMILDLRDTNTDEAITDISWRDHTWTADVSMISASDYASLAGTTTISFDTVTGRVMFPDLSFTGFGTFYLQFRVVSDPPDFNLTLNHKMPIKNPTHVGMIVEETYEVKVKFDVDFDKVLPDVDRQNGFEQMILTEYANLWPDVHLSVGSIYEGSIVVTFMVSGSLANVNTTAYSLCDSIYNGTSYAYNGYSLKLSPYMTINSQTYYGVLCGEIPDDKDDDGLELYLIIIIVILSLLVVGVVAALVIWRCNIKPKTQTHDWRSGTLYNAEQKPENYLFLEDTFASMGFNSARPPVATGMHHLNEKRPLSSFSVRVSTPEPLKKVEVNDGFKQDDYSLSPPPPFYETPATYVEPCDNKPKKSQMDHLRSPSPNSSSGSQSPKLSRSHSPFEGRESPLPPVGESLYHSDYIVTQQLRSPTPHLPAPSPKINRKKRSSEDMGRFHMYK